MMTKQEIHANLCDGLKELYRTKNSDYADSYAKVRDIIPESILVRLHDKLGRITQLMLNQKAGQEVKDESIEDTLRDLANYSLLELVEREFEKQSEEVDRLVIDFGSIDKAEDFKGSINGEPIDNTYDKSEEVSEMTSEEVVEYYKQKEVNNE